MKRIICVAISALALCSCNPSAPVDTSLVTITLDPNGGVISKDKVVVKKNTVYSEDLFPTPTKDGYVFSYWSYPNDDLIPIEKTYTISNDVTLKAQYAKAIKVSFDTDGGSTLSPTYIGKGEIYKASLFPTPSKLDYVFTNWALLIDGVESNIPDVYVFNDDVTLKAKYRKKDDKEYSKDELYIKNLNINKASTSTDYLYTATCTDVDYTLAYNYFVNNRSLINNIGKIGCSSIYSNGFAGHNFDLIYSTYPEFVVKTAASDTRHASIGVAYDYLLKSSEVGKTSNMLAHKLLPFLTFDGVNDAGFFVSANEVPSIDKEIGRVEHTDTSKEKMNTLNVVRYLLDYASSVEDAKALMKEKDFFTPSYINEFHYLVADKSGNSAVIEFKKRSDNSTLSDIIFYKLNESQYKGIMTNFSFNNYTGDSFTYTKEDSSLTNHAEGVERYNILFDKLINKGFNINNLDNMLDILRDVYYTNTYKYIPSDMDNFWYSEFNYSRLTKTCPNKLSDYVDDYNSLYNSYKSHYPDDRVNSATSGSYYISRHSVAYDLANQELKLVFEENILNIYTYKL